MKRCTRAVLPMPERPGDQGETGAVALRLIQLLVEKLELSMAVDEGRGGGHLVQLSEST